MFKLLDKLLRPEIKKINGEFCETYPKVSSTVVPENIDYEDWKKGAWIKNVERKSPLELLKNN